MGRVGTGRDLSFQHRTDCHSDERRNPLEEEQNGQTDPSLRSG